jgi:phage host-nuclease inhibitor protein Gam
VSRLKELGLGAYLRVREEPDKQGIMAHHDKLDLKALGVKRSVALDQFYIELDKEK